MVLDDHSIRDLIHPIKINLSPAWKTSWLLIYDEIISFFVIIYNKFSFLFHNFFFFLLQLEIAIAVFLNLRWAQNDLWLKSIWRNKHIVIQTQRFHLHSRIFTQTFLVAGTSNWGTPAKPNVIKFVDFQIQHHSCNSNLVVAYIWDVLGYWACYLNESVTKSSPSNRNLLA